MFGTGSSFQLARVFGIRIGVNASWFIVLFLFIYLFQGQFEQKLAASDTVAFAVAVVAALLFFGSILLHELGHALAARREGIEVTGIELFLFGGVMKMSRDTDTPGAEFRVAAAGPAVTLLIVIVGGLLGMLLVGPDRLLDSGVPQRQPERGHPDRARVRARQLQPPAARVQPRPRVPARRRADRARGGLAAHRRPRQGDPLLGPPRAALRGDSGRLRRLPGPRSATPGACGG